MGQGALKLVYLGCQSIQKRDVIGRRRQRCPFGRRILGAHSICHQILTLATYYMYESEQVIQLPEPQNLHILNGDNDAYFTGSCED